jgi:hypothetical protein
VQKIARTITLLLEIGASSLATIIIQLIAVLSCDPADYGSFSLIYIIWALFLSLAVSFVSEPWVVESRRRTIGWETYAQPSMFLAVGAGVVTFSACAWEVGLELSALFSLAVLCGIYRTLARFYSAFLREQRYLIPVDLVYVLVAMACWASIGGSGSPLEGIALSWLAGGLVACVLSRPVRWPHFRLARAWVCDSWQTMRGLLADMLLLNVGTIVTPLVLRVPMGAANFGLYRLQSTLAVPTRLIMAPIRPLLGNRPLRWHYQARNVVALIGLSVGLGALMFIGLGWLGRTHLMEESVIHAAAEHYRLEISLFVSATLPTMYLNSVNRIGISARGLIVQRGVHLVGLVGGPILGFLVGGVGGAMWGAIAAEVSQTLVYLVLSRRWAL